MIRDNRARIGILALQLQSVSRSPLVTAPPPLPPKKVTAPPHQGERERQRRLRRVQRTEK